MFQLSATLHGHDEDVRALTCFGNSTIVSGSRDGTVRVWERGEGDKFDAGRIRLKTSAFVNALASLDYEHIVSGGNDNLVNVLRKTGDFTTDNEPELCFVGHTANVCAIDTHETRILTSSWDGTARVWDLKGQTLFELKGHEHAVWGAKFIDADRYVTCGADGTLRWWTGAKETRKLKAHEDVVRDVVVFPDGRLATCSNDTTINVWDAQGALLTTLVGHTSFVYSLALAANGDLVSCGEDRSVRVWREGQCVQVITLPCLSVWKVVCLPNGDIVCGSSDSLVRVFTADASRLASEGERAVFRKQLEESSVSENAMEGVSKAALPGPESLKNDGTTEGEMKYVSVNGKVEMHQWTGGAWAKIGEVVSGESSNQKKFYNGSYYDYVFDVDIADGAPPLKLLFNLSQNPYEAAEKFLADNNLPYSYLQEIVNFILQNAEGVTLDASGAGAIGGSGTGVAGPPRVLPIKAYVGFLGFNEAQILRGFNKLNPLQSTDNQLTVSQFETMLNCQDYTGLGATAGDIIATWTDDGKLLGFDLLRGVITKIQPFNNLFPIVRSGLESNSPKVAMMALRVVANTFLCKWGEQMFMDDEILDVVFAPNIVVRTDKATETSLATLALNLAVLCVKFGQREMAVKLANIVQKLATSVTDEEAAYRLLCAGGTLATLDPQPWLVDAFASFTASRFTAIKSELSN